MKSFRAIHRIRKIGYKEAEETVLVIKILDAKNEDGYPLVVFVRTDNTMGVDGINIFKDCELDWSGK